MSVNTAVRSLWQAALLGALNGLLAGCCAHAALRLRFEYLRREWERRASYGESILFAEPLPLSFLLIWGVLTFAAASALVHHLLARRDTNALLLWLCIGVVAVLFGTLGFALLISVEDVILGRAFGEGLSRFSPEVVRAQFVGAFGIVVPLNLIYGGLVHVLARGRRKSKVALP